MKKIVRNILVALLMLAVGLTAVACSTDSEIEVGNNCTHTYSNNCDISCNECGAGRTVEGHVAEADDNDCTTAIICKNCGGVMTAGKTQHVANADDGDCTTAITCTQCDHVMTAADEHDFSGAWQHDDQDHWRACLNEGCTATDSKAAHNKNESGVCTDCGKIIDVTQEHTHEYTILNKSDVSGHWNECACGARDTVVAHSLAEGAEKNCTVAACCATCQWVITPAGEHTAEADDGDCTTDIKCSECGKTAVAGRQNHVDNNDDDVCDEENCNHVMKPLANDGANTEGGWGEIIRPNR